MRAAQATTAPNLAQSAATRFTERDYATLTAVEELGPATLTQIMAVTGEAKGNLYNRLAALCRREALIRRGYGKGTLYQTPSFSAHAHVRSSGTPTCRPTMTIDGSLDPSSDPDTDLACDPDVIEVMPVMDVMEVIDDPDAEDAAHD